MSSKVWRFGAVAASATILSVISVAVAQAGSSSVNCVASRGSFTCVEVWGGEGGGLGRVIQIPAPLTDEGRAAFADRDRKWSARCQPSVRYDDYGVVRYSYAAPGCAFGQLTD